MNLQPYPQPSPLPASPTQQHQSSPHQAKDLNLLHLFWPKLSTPRDIRWYQVFLTYTTSTFEDLESRFSLPIAQTESALATLIAKQSSPRTDAATSAQQEWPNPKIPEAPRHALQTILRLWTMLDIQLEPPKFLTGAQSPVWLDHEPITATTQRFFSEKATASQSVSDLPPTIDASLTAARLVADYGIQMVRTSNLAEHLTINNWNPKRRVLRVFEHKVWVLNHMLSPETSPLPSDVLEELMRTFHLLFPTMDDATDLLLRKHGMADSVYALGLCGKDRSLSWSNYQYWLKDILNLNSVLSEAPQGARQLLRVDNKDKNSLLNVVLFWVSGMVAFLTIVSTVCGAWAISLAIESKDISVKSLDVSIKSMDISIKGLELAIAQACADPEIAPKLTQYCHPS